MTVVGQCVSVFYLQTMSTYNGYHWVCEGAVSPSCHPTMSKHWRRYQVSCHRNYQLQQGLSTNYVLWFTGDYVTLLGHALLYIADLLRPNCQHSCTILTECATVSLTLLCQGQSTYTTNPDKQIVLQTWDLSLVHAGTVQVWTIGTC